jgi:hypothetical protein
VVELNRAGLGVGDVFVVGAMVAVSVTVVEGQTKQMQIPRQTHKGVESSRVESRCTRHNPTCWCPPNYGLGLTN